MKLNCTSGSIRIVSRGRTRRSDSVLSKNFLLVEPKSGLNIGNADIHSAFFQHLLRFFSNLLLEATLFVTARSSYRVIAVLNPVLCTTTKIGFILITTLNVLVVNLLGLLKHQIRITQMVFELFARHTFGVSAIIPLFWVTLGIVLCLSADRFVWACL